MPCGSKEDIVVVFYNDSVIPALSWHSNVVFPQESIILSTCPIKNFALLALPGYQPQILIKHKASGYYEEGLVKRN